jgi:hypothetical protein
MSRNLLAPEARRSDSSAPVDEDERDASRLAGQVDGVSPRLAIESGLAIRPSRRPDRPDERGRGAEPSRRDRLVAALAAMVSREAPADHGLARAGQSLGGDDEVDVDRPPR